MLPRSRSTFNKRQKEQARQPKQRDKAQRRSRRKQEKSQPSMSEVDDLREYAEAEAALFQVNSAEPISLSNSRDETPSNTIGADAKVASPSSERERRQS